MFAQIGRFGLVGILATAVHFVVMVLLVEGFSLSATLATILGSVAGILTSYLGNHHYVFEVEQSDHLATFSRFLISYLIVLSVHGGLMYLMTERMGFPYIGVFVIATGFSATATFLANRFWVFAQR